MKNMFIVLLVIAALVLNTQLVYAEPQSEGAAAGGQVMRYGEQFNDNSANQWEIFDTSMASARISDGSYYIKNKSELGEFFVMNTYDFPFSKEFTVEVAVKTVSASSDNFAYGFVFGANDASNSYSFELTGGEAYSVKKYTRGVSEELANGKIVKRMLFQKGGFNSLKIEKQGDRWRFYINNYYAAEIPGANMQSSGSKIGFIVAGLAEMAVDYTKSEIWPD